MKRTPQRLALRLIVFAVVFAPAFLRPGWAWSMLFGHLHLVDLTLLAVLIFGLGCGAVLSAVAVVLAFRAFARFIVGAAG